MVRNIPERRFKKASVAFDEEARLRLCESSGSEHSPAADSSTDLFDLVASFVEGEGETRVEEGWEGSAVVDDRNDVQDDDDGGRGCGFEYETAKERLEEIFGYDLGQGDKRILILGEVEEACKSIRHEENSLDFKRGLMVRLRKRGLDAGLCKSRWDKTGKFPAGEYQYVDVNIDGDRYIVEISLVGQFEVARPTDQFKSLLEMFPLVFVGTSDELKEVVRILSAAIRESLKSRGMVVPPWRKSGYMKAKWFSSYKRSTTSTSKPKCTNGENRLISGFAPPLFIPTASYCREVLATNVKHKTGLLTEALGSQSGLASINN